MPGQAFPDSIIPEQLLPEVLTLLKRLISFDTSRRPEEPGMPFGRESAKALNWLLETAGQEGFTVGNFDNYCGYIEYGTGSGMYAIVCHLDVVPTGDPAEWQSPPFELDIRDGAVYGRGCSDNKGPLAIVFQLLRELKKNNVQLKHRLRLIIGCGEETGASCLEHYCKHGELPLFAITPDAEYPVVCGECGIVHFSLKKEYAPGENMLRLNAGTVINAVPGKAEAEFDGKQFYSSGKTAHASHPEAGENALVKLCCQLDRKVKSDFPALVLKINRKDLNLELEDDFSKLTLVPSVANVNERQALLKCDIRFPVTMKSRDIISRLEKAFDNSGYTLEIDMVDEPLYFAPESSFIQSLLDAYSSVTGDYGATPLVIGGGTYAKYLPGTVAFGCELPGSEITAHEVDEHWSLEDIKINIKILAKAIWVLDSLEKKSF